MIRLAGLALVLAVTNPPACEPDDNSAVDLPNTCIVKPDYPHHSHHVTGRMNGEGGIKCSEQFPSATVYVLMKKETSSGTWVTVDRGSDTFTPLPANKRRTAQADILCNDGVFRVTVRAEVRGEQSIYKSGEYHGKAVENPCDQ